MTNDAFVAVTQMPHIYWDESHRLYFEKKAVEAEFTTQKTKKDKAADLPVEESNDEPPQEIPYMHEGDVLVDKQYSDEPSRLKSLAAITQSMPETHLFYLRKSNISIYRFEEVIFNVFPHLATHKRRAANTREIFLTNDPFTKNASYAVAAAQQVIKDTSQLNMTGSVPGSDGISEEQSQHNTTLIGDSSKLLIYPFLFF